MRLCRRSSTATLHQLSNRWVWLRIIWPVQIPAHPTVSVPRSGLGCLLLIRLLLILLIWISTGKHTILNSLNFLLFRLSTISSRFNSSFGHNFSYPTHDFLQNVSRRTSLCTGSLAHKSMLARRHRANGSQIELGDRTSSKITLLDDELYDILFAFGWVFTLIKCYKVNQKFLLKDDVLNQILSILHSNQCTFLSIKIGTFD